MQKKTKTFLSFFFASSTFSTFFYCYLFIYSLFTRHFLPLYLHLIWIRIVHFVVYSPVRFSPIRFRCDVRLGLGAALQRLHNESANNKNNNKRWSKKKKRNEININIFINSKKRLIKAIVILSRRCLFHYITTQNCINFIN